MPGTRNWLNSKTHELLYFSNTITMSVRDRRTAEFVESQKRLLAEPPMVSHTTSGLESVDPAVIQNIVEGIQRRKAEYMEALFKDRDEGLAGGNDMIQYIPPMPEERGGLAKATTPRSLHRLSSQSGASLTDSPTRGSRSTVRSSWASGRTSSLKSEELDEEYLRSRSGWQIVDIAEIVADSPQISAERRQAVARALDRYQRAEIRNSLYRSELADMERGVTLDPVELSKMNLPGDKDVSESVAKIGLLARNYTHSRK